MTDHSGPVVHPDDPRPVTDGPVMWDWAAPRRPGEVAAKRHPFEPVPGTDAETFVQWKGTELCMDLYCGCSPQEPRHFDAAFAYYVRCPACGAVYEAGTQLKMRRLAAGELPACNPAESVDE